MPCCLQSGKLIAFPCLTRDAPLGGKHYKVRALLCCADGRLWPLDNNHDWLCRLNDLDGKLLRVSIDAQRETHKDCRC
jgi:hypothetical protein